MTEPTEHECHELLMSMEPSANEHEAVLKFARAVLAKWGQPQAVAGGEPVAWMWQHDETGRTGFVDCWQVENGWQENNPRLRIVSKLYTTQQPTQAPAGAVPLTPEQITAAAKKLAECMEYPWDHMPEQGRAEMRKHARAVLSAANCIKGGQHGTE